MFIVVSLHILSGLMHSGLDNWIRTHLKGLAQAKIIKKSVILFWLLNMTIWCKHVHGLELQKFIIFVLRIHQLDYI